MKCLILAAGYGTRMYPLTDRIPKPLLEIEQKPLINYLTEDLEKTSRISEYLIVTNHKFIHIFEAWRNKLPYKEKVKLFDDGSTENDNRLGAVNDMAFVLNLEKISEPLLIIAGDNFLNFSLKNFIEEFLLQRRSMVMFYKEKDNIKLKKTGVAVISENGLIVSMEEKPQNPKSNLAIPPFYLLKAEDLSLIGKGIASGCGVDSPGSLLSWMCKQTEIGAMEMPGSRYDIGDLDSYRNIRKARESGNCVLVTGAAGFIGAALSLSLLKEGRRVIGIDNLNSYYDICIKKSRLAELEAFPEFTFIKGDLSDKEFIKLVFEQYCPSTVVNLAAQAGVRYSIQNPGAYMESNIIGFFNILEEIRKTRQANRIPVEHLVFASSSSVYGLQNMMPYKTSDKTDQPVSFYAATKKSNELMAHAYSKIYGIPCTGLRFFTVYGPKGRPDMAYYSFTEKMIRGDMVSVYNHGEMYRDFTYIDDIVAGIRKVLNKLPVYNEAGVPYKIYNIGSSKPESLGCFISTLEKILKEEGLIKEGVKREYLPMQPGDVYQTYADMSEMEKDFDFHPVTGLEEGLRRFVLWYKDYNQC